MLGLETGESLRFRRATVTGQVREWDGLLGVPRLAAGPAALAVVITGIVMGMGWGAQPWIVAGMFGIVIIAILSAALSGRRTAAIVRAIPAEDGPIPRALVEQLRDPVLTLSLCLRTALFLGIAFVMSIRPGTTVTLTAMGIALAIGLAVAVPAWKLSMPSVSGAARPASSRFESIE